MESSPTRAPGRWVALLHLVLFAGAIGLAASSGSADRWAIGPLLILAAFAVGSELCAVSAESGLIHFSGSFLGIVLAAVLLGGAPAALIGVITIALGWFRSRESMAQLRNNLVLFAWFPLLAGLACRAMISITGAGAHSLDFYVIVFATFVLALALNFAGFAAHTCYYGRTSLARLAAEAVVPVLPAELFSAVLALAAVIITQRLGALGLLAFGLVLGIFQYLLGALLVSRQRSQELERLATTDALSGLANRSCFERELERRVASPDRRPIAVLLMDLDRFKEVNDTLGHQYGDRLLQELGVRLRTATAGRGVAARLGGDEFGILLDDATDDETISEFARGLLSTVAEPVSVDELALEVGASIGVTRFPLDAEDAGALLRGADVAMYAAKMARLGLQFYAPEQDRLSVRRLSVLSDVRDALTREELSVYYQPIVALPGYEICAAEALIRWEHPEHGLVSASGFMQLVEQTGLIGPVIRYVLERAIAQCASWSRAGLPPIVVSVNLAPRNLLDRQLPGDIAKLLREHDVNPASLRLELSDSMLPTEVDRATATIDRLAGHGTRLSLDNFGAGQSSLLNLRRLPIDELKLDRGLVGNILRDEAARVIVASSIGLGRGLGLKVVAQGVEDTDTLAQLESLGCELAQGYLLGEPMSPDRFDAWLVARSTTSPDDARGADGESRDASRSPGQTAALASAARAETPSTHLSDRAA